MNKISLFICLVLTAILSGCTPHNTEGEEALNTSDLTLSASLSNLRITSIAEDKEGYIWIGTSRGLNRYNGADMHQYFCNDEPNAIPDNRINDVFCDSKGQIWITTKNGVARHTEQDDFEQIPIKLANPRCQQMAESSRGEIFVTQTNAILKYDEEENAFKKVIEDVSYVDPIFQKTFIDKEDNIWVIDDRGAACYSTSSFNQLEHLDLGENPQIQTAGLMKQYLWMVATDGLHIYHVRERRWVPIPDNLRGNAVFNKAQTETIIKASEEYVLLCTSEGLFLYNPENDRLLHQSQPNFPFSPINFTANLALNDSQGNLWLCSDSQGFAVRKFDTEKFNSHPTLISALRGMPVASLTIDSQQMLWVATQDEGIYSYDTKNEKITYYNPEDYAPLSRNVSRRINHIFADSHDNLWVAVTPRSLLQLRHKGERLELIQRYDVPNVIVLNEDKDGTIWAGCYGNSYFSKRATDHHFQEHHLFSNTFSYLSCLELLRDGSMAALVREQGLRLINPETQELNAPVITDSLLNTCIARSTFLPSTLKEGRDGRLWIGTISNGLMCYDPESQTLENMKGTSCEDIASIEIDQQGDLWISTQYGLGKYNIESKTFTNYYSVDGLSGNEYYDRASCQLADGTLVFGGPHGLTVFNPLFITETREGKILLEDLKVHNRLIRARKDEAIEKKLNLSEKVVLKSDETSFSISFSALDFYSEKRFSYQYMLEGFNSTWVDANSNHEAFFANLRPGSYVFRARITNKDRDNVIAETSIPVIITPPVWGTWWAKLLYLILTFSVIFYIVRVTRKARKERWNLLQSQREKEQEHRINQMNMSFFANVSHEFRTPLTVISGPISQLCQDPEIKGEEHHLLQVVNRSVNRMLHLVNQMMDFHKLENDTLRMEVKRQDIIGNLKQTAEFFAVNAKDKSINFHTHGLDDYFLMWMDADKLDKIMHNLLGNAMKYTPAKGEVSLSFDVVTRDEAASLFGQPEEMTDSQYVKICVTDNGAGIPAEKREKIFERYYQLQSTKNGSNFNWGTGIGLYYARSLALLHHGALKVLDNPEGQGSQFVLLLPINKSAYKESEYAEQEQNQSVLFPLQQTASASASTENGALDMEAASSEASSEASDQSKPHLLVVDDDVEVIHYLKLLLGQQYRVTCRFDAESALETLQRQDQEVDLIMSDVMMPGTSGVQLCQQIKDDPQLCHIPVILVTAKTTVKDQVEGLQAGAMAYVSKPFDPAYLQALIKSLLDSRNHTRQLLKENTQTDALEENALSSQDNAFMTELYRLMEEELANPDMDITRMTELLHISRSKLYYKIKGLTGENPSVFFKQYKLNRAAELLKEGKYNISEISLLTGFSTLSHFSTSFKKQFGVTPSEY